MTAIVSDSDVEAETKALSVTPSIVTVALLIGILGIDGPGDGSGVNGERDLAVDLVVGRSQESGGH